MRRLSLHPHGGESTEFGSHVTMIRPDHVRPGGDLSTMEVEMITCPWCGTNYKSFRLGDERPAIEAFLAKDHGDFFGDASWAT